MSLTERQLQQAYIIEETGRKLLDISAPMIATGQATDAEVDMARERANFMLAMLEEEQSG